MPLSSDVRRGHLEQIREKQRPVRTEKLFYKDEPQTLDVHKIDLNYLIYNRYNDRIATQMATWNAERSVTHEHYDQEVHDQIAKFIWGANPERNKATERDIEAHGQLRAGVVTLDGMIVSGNRRFMILSRIPDRHLFEAVILDDAFEDNVEEIVRLETLYQYEDPTLLYDPLQKYMKVKRLRNEFRWAPEDTAKAMNEPNGKGEIERLLEVADLMDEYLEHIACPDLYELLRDKSGTKEGMFVDLQRDLKRLNGATTKINWDYDKDFDLLKLKALHFDVIRSGEVVGTEKEYRKISHDGSGSKSVFAFKELWEEFSERHTREVDSITASLPDLDEFSQRGDFKTRMDAARARDTEWNEQVAGLIKGNLGRIESKLELRRDTIEPTRLLEKARNLIVAIQYEDPQFTVKQKNLELVKEINSICYEMKKVFKKAGFGG